jgi:gamma-glutamyl hydrolase
VPIRFYQTDAELARLFKTVNGIIFPGGLTDLYLADPYTVAATKLYKMAVASNDAGVPFPIWGTCLGHQLLQIIVTGAHFGDILVETDAVSHPTTLNFTEAAKASRMWGALFEERPTLVDKLSSPAWNISMENHEFGMPVENYGRASKWPALAANFDVLTTTVDRGGVEYVSTIEHKKYPFFGTQWHPEKPPFEFSDRTIPKSHAAMSVSHYLADTFLDAARACPHAPESVEMELRDLIYNYKPIFTAREIVMEASYDGPDITYFFDKQQTPADEQAAVAPRRAGAFA